MELITNNPAEEEKIIQAVQKILEKNTLLTLATMKDLCPYVNTAYYVADDAWNLYIWTGKKSRHCKNMRKNAHVAVNVFDSKQKWGSLLQGLQMSGKARVVNTKELVHAGIQYMERFPRVVTMVESPKKFHAKVFESVMYKIQITKIKVFDERTFGKEEWREVEIKR